MSEDPIGFIAGDTNLGRYVGNLPMLLTDPTGLADSVSESIKQSAAKGDTAAIQVLIDSGGLNSAQETAARLAIAGILAKQARQAALQQAAAAKAAQQAAAQKAAAQKAAAEKAAAQNAANQKPAAQPQYKKPKPGQSAKEGSKERPSWAEGRFPYLHESGKDFAKRLCDERYGKGKYETGPTSDYNQLKKYAERHFFKE